MKLCKGCGWPVAENGGQRLCIGDWLGGLTGQAVVDYALPLEEQKVIGLVLACGTLLPVRELWWKTGRRKMMKEDWFTLRFEKAVLRSGNVYYTFAGQEGRIAFGWASLEDVNEECMWCCEGLGHEAS